jgi:hypothetical protein
MVLSRQRETIKFNIENQSDRLPLLLWIITVSNACCYLKIVHLVRVLQHYIAIYSIFGEERGAMTEVEFVRSTPDEPEFGTTSFATSAMSLP